MQVRLKSETLVGGVNMQYYVLGFRFTPDKDWVVLIEKQKPDWQKGKLNGVGGKIEAGEDPDKAMVREFREETGMETTVQDWTHALTLGNKEYRMWVFYSIGDISECHTMEAEEVIWGSVKEHPFNAIPNLKWMIPLMLDAEVAHPINVAMK